MNEQRVTFGNCRGETLVGVLHHAGEERKAGSVILCHGMESDKNSDKLIVLSRRLAASGIATLRFDFSYVGESGGKFENITYSGEVEDLRAAFDRMQDEYPGKTAILGSSMGGTVALMFAAQEPRVAALVTIAAPLHPENFPKRILTARQIKKWRDRGHTLYNGRRLNVTLLEDLERIQVADAVRQIRCPVLILHGDADEVVPVAEAFELHDCINHVKRLSILKDTDHRLANPAGTRQAMAEAVAWLKEHLGLFH